RIALEVKRCLRAFSAGPGEGRYPWPAPPCEQADPDPAQAWRAVPATYFGRVADMTFDSACNIPDTPDHTWWAAWRPQVFYALARDYSPASDGAIPCTRPGACLEITDRAGRIVGGAKEIAVVVAGRPLV